MSARTTPMVEVDLVEPDDTGETRAVVELPAGRRAEVFVDGTLAMSVHEDGTVAYPDSALDRPGEVRTTAVHPRLAGA